VRSTSVECGDPPVPGQAWQFHCASLKLNRRTGTEAWQGWRLPLSSEESQDQWAARTDGRNALRQRQPIQEQPGQPSPRKHPCMLVEPCQGHAKGTLIQGKQNKGAGIRHRSQWWC